MTLQPDTQADVLLFHAMMSIEVEDHERDRREAWKSDTSLEILAREIVRHTPDLARLLAAEEQSKQVDKDFSVILFWANGGPSHIDLFDLKPDAPDGPRASSCVSTPGTGVSKTSAAA